MNLSPVGVLLVCAGAAAADVAPVGGEIRASAGVGWRAFDADTNTAWCGGAAGGSLVVRFAQPVVVRALEVYGAPTPDEATGAPATLTVTGDAGAVRVVFDGTVEEPTTIALPAGAVRSLTFQLGARPAGEAAPCLAEIHVELVDQALVYGVSAAAVAALPAALTTLEDALRRCDRRRLARLARFPVGFREIAMGGRRAYPPDAAATDPRAYRRPRDLPCTWAVTRDDEGTHRPQLDGGIAPGVVRVDGGTAVTTVYWELAWRARRWQLIALDTVFFE